MLTDPSRARKRAFNQLLEMKTQIDQRKKHETDFYRISRPTHSDLGGHVAVAGGRHDRNRTAALLLLSLVIISVGGWRPLGLTVAATAADGY